MPAMCDARSRQQRLMMMYVLIMHNRSDEGKAKEKEEPVPDTVLSAEDLDARIAELGLGQAGGVEDKSTGEDPQELLRPMERVQKEAVKLGTTAIGSTVSGVINVSVEMHALMTSMCAVTPSGVLVWF